MDDVITHQLPLERINEGFETSMLTLTLTLMGTTNATLSAFE